MKCLFPIALVAAVFFTSCERPATAGKEALREREAGIALREELLAEERALVEARRLELEEEREQLRREREADLDRRRLELQAREGDAAERELEVAGWEGRLSAEEESVRMQEELLDQRELELSEKELEVAGTGALESVTVDEPLESQLPVADYDLFYDELGDSGSWYETEDYGYVYQPTVVVQNSGWRPYLYGSWVCTNLGWYWRSNEPFGWACYHYGRWANIGGRGWCWVPGSEWAPSWVSWRQSSDCVGWAPLPPETLCNSSGGWGASVCVDFGIHHDSYNFIDPVYLSRPVWKHCRPWRGNAGWWKKTRGCTKITRHHDRVVSGGPKYAGLKRRVKDPWPVRQLDFDRVSGLGRGVEALAARRGALSGSKLKVFAPRLDTPWNVKLKPRKVAGRLGRVEVVRADGGIRKEWQGKARDARVKEAAHAEKWTQEMNRAAGGSGGVIEERKRWMESNRERYLAVREKAGSKSGSLPQAGTSDRVKKEGKGQGLPDGVVLGKGVDRKRGEVRPSTRPDGRVSSSRSLAERMQQERNAAGVVARETRGDEDVRRLTAVEKGREAGPPEPEGLVPLVTDDGGGASAEEPVFRRTTGNGSGSARFSEEAQDAVKSSQQRMLDLVGQSQDVPGRREAAAREPQRQSTGRADSGQVMREQSAQRLGEARRGQGQAQGATANRARQQQQQAREQSQRAAADRARQQQQQQQAQAQEQAQRAAADRARQQQQQQAQEQAQRAAADRARQQQAREQSQRAAADRARQQQQQQAREQSQRAAADRARQQQQRVEQARQQQRQQVERAKQVQGRRGR